MDIRPGAESADLTLPSLTEPPGAGPARGRRRMMAVYTTFVVACLALGVWSVLSGSLPTWRPVLWGIGGFGAAALYVLPATFALLQRHHRKDRIVALNIAFGWIPIVWVVCLVWGLRSVPQPVVERPAIAAAKTPPSDLDSDSESRIESDTPSNEVARLESPSESAPESQLLPLIPVQRMSNPFELPDPTTTRELVAQNASGVPGNAAPAEHLAAAQARVERRQLTGGPRYALQPGPSPAEKWMESIAVKAAADKASTNTNAAPSRSDSGPAADKPAPDPASIVDLAPPSE